MPTIPRPSSRNITTSRKIRLARSSPASILLGTTVPVSARAASQWTVTYATSSVGAVTQLPRNPNCSRTSTSPFSTAQKRSLLPKTNTALLLTPRVSGKSKALSSPLCISQEPSTTSCFSASAPSVLNRPTPAKQHQRQSTNFSTTLSHVQTTASHIAPSSDMVLCGHSDAAYLNATRARSHACIFLLEDKAVPRLNGSVLTVAQIINFGLRLPKQNSQACLLQPS